MGLPSASGFSQKTGAVEHTRGYVQAPLQTSRESLDSFPGPALETGPFQGLVDAFTRAVRVTDINLDHSPACAPLDDLAMGQRARDTELHLRQPSSTALATGLIRLPKDCGKQAGIVGVTIGYQHPVVAVRQAAGSIAE